MTHQKIRWNYLCISMCSAFFSFFFVHAHCSQLSRKEKYIQLKGITTAPTGSKPKIERGDTWRRSGMCHLVTKSESDFSFDGAWCVIYQNWSSIVSAAPGHRRRDRKKAICQLPPPQLTSSTTSCRRQWNDGDFFVFLFYLILPCATQGYFFCSKPLSSVWTCEHYHHHHLVCVRWRAVHENLMPLL